MPQTGTILMQGFQGGIGNHDTYLGENQVAYAENVHLRDPEFISLGKKPENYALTNNDLVLSKLELERNGRAYLGTDSGKMYNKGTNDVLCTTATAKAITNIFYRYTYVYFTIGNARLGRILTNDLVGGSGWTSGDLEAQASYTETHKTSSEDIPVKLVEATTDIVYCLCPSQLKKADNAFAYTNLAAISGIGAGLWKTLNYRKLFTHKGVLGYTDGANNILNASLDLNSFYIEGIYANNKEFLVSGIAQENTAIFLPSGEDKQSIAVSRVSGPDNKKVHWYGRNSTPNGLTDARFRQSGNDTHGSYHSICYMINNGSVMSYGHSIPGLKDAWSLMTRNYNGDLIDEVGMVKVETNSDGTNYLYFSWRSGSNCGVDRINLDKINKPDTYISNGYIYTQKYNFGHAKATVNKIKIRAYTTSTATIKVYCSVDGGARQLKQTLSETNPKKYFLLDSHEQGYTIQWKLELETSNENETPLLYAMSFNYSIGDNE